MDLGTISARIAVGLVVGILVGLTGLGGGMLLLPLLISVLGVPPIMAVGTDAVINCITKIGAGALHWRRGNVSWRLALSLAYGSIPGAILGVTLLARIRAIYGSGVNDFLKIVIGILLIVIPIAYYLKKRPTDLTPSLEAMKQHEIPFWNHSHRLLCRDPRRCYIDWVGQRHPDAVVGDLWLCPFRHGWHRYRSRHISRRSHWCASVRFGQRRSEFGGVRHRGIDPWRTAWRLSHQVPACTTFSTNSLYGSCVGRIKNVMGLVLACSLIPANNNI